MDLNDVAIEPKTARKPKAARKSKCKKETHRNPLTNRCLKTRNDLTKKCWMSKVLKYKRKPPCDSQHVEKKSPYGLDCCYSKKSQPGRKRIKKTTPVPMEVMEI